MEQQTKAMRSMFAVLRARARTSITTGREGTRFVSLQHQKQTGNSKLGLSSCRESHSRQKGGKAQGGLYPAGGGTITCEGPVATGTTSPGASGVIEASGTTPLARAPLAPHPFISRIYAPCPMLARNNPTSRPQTFPPARP